LIHTHISTILTVGNETVIA